MASTEFKDSEFGRFQDGTQKVIRLAQLLGWKVEWRNAGRKVLGVTSPNRNKTFNIPTTNVNSNRVSSYISSLWHHTDRAAWAEILAGHDDLASDPILASVVAVLGTSIYMEMDQIKAERDAAAPQPDGWGGWLPKSKHDKGHLPDLEQRLRVRGEQPLPITEFEQPTQEDEVTEVESAKHYDNEPEWFRAPMFDEYGSEWWSTRIDGDIFFECRAHEEPFRTNNSNSRGSHTGSHSPAWQESRERAGVTKHNRRIISRAPWRRKSDGEVSTAIIDEERADGTHTYLCAQCRKFRSPSPQAVGGHSASHRKVEPKVEREIHPLDEVLAEADAADLVGVWQQAVVSTPETSSDLIDQVRALLVTPGTDKRIERLEAQNTHLQGLVDYWRQRAGKAESDLATLAELIQSVRPS